MSWVLTKLVGYIERVGTVNYELNVSECWHSTTGETIKEHYGTKTKKILDESIGLPRSLSLVHWFLELTSLAGAAIP